ncbi:TPA: ATP-binding protein [Vibrio parahaemolyticus]|nr:ATP-binding protein [Vibrio parahaemolyticus]
MSKSVPFVTRARTLDHLGREQIADCPTAISELWKNAFDAYARNVSLHIISGRSTVAAIVDDGHGMNQDEFINKWLVVGTESKKTNTVIDLDDRNGLDERPKQGQKGIGRLSCAIMGSLLLIVSKRKRDRFVASLVDWRLFENPYLYLHDIQIPVEEFDSSEELETILPSMYSQLLSNLYGDEDDHHRRERIVDAWESFSNLEIEEQTNSTQLDLLLDDENSIVTTFSQIEVALKNITFNKEHFEKWDVWKGLNDRGTALFISEVNEDIEAQLLERTTDSTVAQARSKFSETLSNFSELLVSKDKTIFDTFEELEQTDEYTDIYLNNEFNHKVLLWKGRDKDILISSSGEFSSYDFDKCEHILSGYVNRDGVFRGKIKSFGELRGDVEILPNIAIPKHARSRVGEFYITVASYENLERNTTLDGETWSYLNEVSNNYAGFLVYRDTLRVMPYGRDDNDFFEIEARRSKNAGQYHYSNRNIFGRVMISGEHNKNLRDKAGREGFIDNKAAKVFRDIVNNILISASNRYIGRHSELRKTLQPILNIEYDERKAKAERAKKKKIDQKRFIKTLIANYPKINELHDSVNTFVSGFLKLNDTYDHKELDSFIEDISEFKRRLNDLKFSGVPSKLGDSEKTYRDFRDKFSEISQLLNNTQQSIDLLQEKLSPKTNSELIENRINSIVKSYKRDVSNHISFIRSEFSKEIERLTKVTSGNIGEIESELNKIRHEVTNDIISLQQGFTSAEKKLDDYQIEVDTIFSAYSIALDNLKNDIDLNAIASYDMKEFEQLQNEVIRLNSLAQLGITVEIISHELSHLDAAMFDRMEHLISNNLVSKEVLAIKETYEGISSKFKFLAPLRLSGTRIKEKITGKDIEQYLEEFFKGLLTESQVSIEFSDSFRRITIREEKSRIFPVFVNLINNSRYWVCQKSGNDRKILVDCIDGRVIISDDGPGVDIDDVRNLFTIFFTKKATGGRGIGLYLCRANLTVGGHKIAYITKDNEKILSGANFAIDFKGLIYG